jgi:5'/3'-nucleotidase
MVVAGTALALLLGACGDDSGGGEEGGGTTTTTTPATTTTAAPEPLRILVGNDDGVAAPGIDALVEGLQTLENVEITVSAPAENQSGTGDQSTPGDDPAEETTTSGGYPATAVSGFPADAVLQGLEGMAEPPDLVVSGVNEGQNIGPLTEVSGTVGAALTAARQGIPALAVSQGVYLQDGPEPDYPTAVALALDWVTEHRDALVGGEPTTGTATVTNLNVPTCRTGEVGDLLEVPVATQAQIEGLDLFAPVCEGGGDDATNDVEGFLAGHPVLSELTA